MDFLKKHYEKIILGVVLLGLAVAVAFIPFKVGSERKELEDKRLSLIPRSVKPLTNLDLTVPETAIKRAAAPVALDFSSTHRLFNPMPWQKAVTRPSVCSQISRPRWSRWWGMMYRLLNWSVA